MHINGKFLIDIGYPEGKAIGVAIKLIQSELRFLPENELVPLLIKVLNNPEMFTEDTRLAPLAMELISPPADKKVFALAQKPGYFKVYGAEGIEEGALQQMHNAMRLPITKAGALMPDAHQGYGLPIGGVLATDNAVIPFGVGVDIGCRMCMTLYDFPESFIQQNKEELKKALTENTRFGRDAFKKPKDHSIFERREFREIHIVKLFKDRAFEQIGSSGGGNHFVEFGITEIMGKGLDLPKGSYLAVLSHSGSRGFGANIARHYTTIAMEKCQLPKEARHLAWLDLDSEEGQEYWMAMNLAGDYASACHHQIHERLSMSLGREPLKMIENHHNFAWKEKDGSGNEIIVHRKGATPAGKGDIGIIPGSMATPGFIVKGKGSALSINSAAHGAGRVMSRTQAKQKLSKNEVSRVLKAAGVEVIGSGLDEAPMAYKDINQVMGYQKDLVDILGTFSPKIVRMCGDTKYHEVD
jgi:tRNA-splicing ligase RtcB (3'-phosphate/5'-hydroxy nucleic acid ligase)